MGGGRREGGKEIKGGQTRDSQIKERREGGLARVRVEETGGGGGLLLPLLSPYSSSALLFSAVCGKKGGQGATTRQYKAMDERRGDSRRAVDRIVAPPSKRKRKEFGEKMALEEFPSNKNAKRITKCVSNTSWQKFFCGDTRQETYFFPGRESSASLL